MVQTRFVIAVVLIALLLCAEEGLAEGPFVVTDVTPIVMDEDLRCLPMVDLSKSVYLVFGKPLLGWENYVP